MATTSHGEHKARDRGHGSRRRASVRKPTSKPLPEAQSNVESRGQDQAEDAVQALTGAEPWDEREPERESTFDRAQNELGDIEREVESDHCRRDSDIERSG